MVDRMATLTAPAGRLLLSLIFILSAVGKLQDLKGTAAYMASKGMPLTSAFLAAAIVLELGGGLSVLLGWKTRLGALALAVFIIPASVIFHNFWAFEGMQAKLEMINFLKNLSILGGLIVLFARGPGSLSIDGRKQTT